MAQSYTRQSSFADGDTITAALFNNEYNQLVNAFSYSSTNEATTGHRHDGSAGEGGNIPQIGDLDFLNKIVVDSTNNRWGFYVEVSSVAVEQLRLQDGALIPVTDSDVDLGTSSLYFKDAYIDTVTTTGNVSIGGNLTVTGNATISGNLTFGDADTDSINLAAEIDSDIIPNTDGTYDLGSATKEWQDLYIDGTANIDSLVADTADINGGTIDGATIATSDITVGAGKTLDVSAGTLTLADDQISGDKVEGGTIAATTITTLTSTTGNITNVNATTVDSTNLEVTNLKAKDGTSAGSIADSTGVVTLASSVLTTTDINGGTIDGVTIGGTTAGAVTFTDLSDGTITITAFVDEDDMTSNSATLVPTQQSVKAYVDSQVTAQDLDFAGDTGGALSIDLDSESLTIAGGTGIDTSGATNTLTVAIDSTVATLTDTQTLTNKTLTSPDVNTPDIDGGTIDGTVIGGTTTAAGSFTTLQADTSLNVDGTVTADGLTVVGSGSNIRYDVASSNPHTNPTLHLENQNATDGNVAALMLSADNANGVGGSAYIYAQSETTNQKGNLVFAREDGANTPVTSMKLSSNGDISFYEDTGTTAQMVWDASADALTFTDSSKAIFGAGSDLQIYHDGSNSYIEDAGTGSLIIEGTDLNLRANDNSRYLVGTDGSGGSTALYHPDGDSIKLATTSTGIDVTGTVVADDIGIGTTNPSSNLHIIGGTNAARTITIGDSSGNNVEIRAAISVGNPRLVFLTAGTEAMRIDESQNVGIGTTSPATALDVTGTVTATDLLIDTDVIVTDSTNDRVGINNASPSTTLDVGGSIYFSSILRATGDGSAAAPSIQPGNDGDTGLFRPTTNTIGFSTGGTEQMRLTSTGLGIGTTSPSVALEISDSTNNAILRLTRNDTIITVGNQIGALEFAGADTDDAGVSAKIIAEAESGAGQTALAMYTGTPSALSERLRIDKDGNVGIGTTSPIRALDVRGGTTDIVANFESSDAGGYIALQDNSTSSDTAVLVGAIGDALRIDTGDTESLRIDSSGNVGIGTSSPDALLEVAGTTNDALFNLTGAGTNFELRATSGNGATANSSVYRLALDYLNGTYTNSFIDFYRGSAGNNGYLAFGSSGSEAMRIDSSGNVGIGTSSPSTTLHLSGTTGTSLRITDNFPTIQLQDASETDKNFQIRVDGQLLRFQTQNDAFSSASEKMVIDSSGNVGIGTTSPSSKLDVAGNIGSSGTISSTSILNCNGSGSADSQVNIGIGRNANGYAFLDLIGDTTYTDYGLRIIRNNSGANTTSVIQHRGTGTLGLLTQEAADIRFSTNNAEAMRIDSSGNVGIGASSPDSLLHLSGGSAEKIIIEDSSNPRGNYIGIEGSDNLIIAADEDNLGSSSKIQFRVDADEKMVILNNGNVGIGATSPSKILHLAASSPVIRLEDSEGGYGEISGSNGNIRLRTDQGNTQSSSFVSFEVDTAEEMRLTSTGLGIKTTSPQESIHTTGNIRLGDSAPAEIYTNSSELRLGVDRNNDNSTSDITFYTNNNEKVRIDADGNLLVGTTSLGDVNNIVNGHLFEAANSTAGEGAVGVYNNTGTANCPALLVLNRDTSTDSTNRFVQFYADVTSSGATAMGGIVGNGASNVQFATLSDEREKENITPVDNVLDKLMNLNVVSFDWKKNDEHVKAGFIAQNVEKHFPEYVIENIANDGEEPRKGTTGGMSAGYIAVLTKAIQEQQTQIEALQSEINLLKGE